MRLPLILLSALAVTGAAAALPAPGPAGPAAGPRLEFPLACVIGRDCEVQHYVDRDPGPGVRDYRCGPRTYQGHSGIDIRLLDMAEQRAGVNVLAAAAGRVTRLRDGVQDISIRAPGAPPVKGRECGNGVVVDHGDGWETQYCHLAQGSIVVTQNQMVTAGQPLAKVGLSGDTEFPHLHITVRRQGKIIDPFAPDMSNPASCQAQPPLWSPAAMRQMSYKAGAVLNTGFTSGPVDMDAVQAGGLARPTPGSPMLVAYATAIELEAGDRVELTLSAPDGRQLATTANAPLDRNKAQYLTYVGVKRPPAGWKTGLYRAEFRVRRGENVVLSQRFEIKF